MRIDFCRPTNDSLALRIEADNVAESVALSEHAAEFGLRVSSQPWEFFVDAMPKKMETQ